MNRTTFVAALLSVVAPAFAGDVSGQAVITKKLSKRELSPLIYNLRGMAQPAVARSTDPVNEYDRMVVILESKNLPSRAAINVVMDQKDSHFDPELVVIPVGSTVQFPNSDPIFHNVFSLSKAQPFDLGFYPRGQIRTVKFSRPGVVQVYCHIHANMYAAIVVTESPWFAKPSTEGTFSFHDVPAGHYRLTAWHKVAGFHAVEINVPESGTVDATIRVPVDVEPRP